MELGISGRYEFRCRRSRGHNDIISFTLLLYRYYVLIVWRRGLVFCVWVRIQLKICVSCVCVSVYYFLTRKIVSQQEKNNHNSSFYINIYVDVGNTSNSRYYGLSILNYIPIPLYSPYQLDGHVKLKFQSVSFVTTRARTRVCTCTYYTWTTHAWQAQVNVSVFI